MKVKAKALLFVVRGIDRYQLSEPLVRTGGEDSKSRPWLTKYCSKPGGQSVVFTFFVKLEKTVNFSGPM